MPIPGQTLTIQDPGLGLAAELPTTPLFMGVSSSGTVGTIYSFSRAKDAIDTLGQGPLVEDLCYALSVAGGPIRAMRLTAGVAGSNGSVTKTALGSSTGTVTVAGTPNDSYEVVVRIVKTGTVGAGKFVYSLDDGRTFSDFITIPSGGTYVLPSTGLTLTFTPGAGPTFFEGTSITSGDRHEFDSAEPRVNATNITAGFTALLADTFVPAFIHLAGTFDTAANAALAAAALVTGTTNCFNAFRYVGAIQDAGADTNATTISGFSAVSSTRLMPGYGRVDIISQKPIVGLGFRRASVACVLAARAADALVSTHLGRVASGSIDGIPGPSTDFGSPVTHDEYLTEAMDVEGFATLRSWIGRSGYYITRGRIKAPPGSDYQRWEYRRVMDLASTVTHRTLQTFINSSVRTKADGTIDEADARKVEAAVNAQLSIALLEPLNAEGTKGHVSAAGFTVDRSNNILQSNTLQGNVAIQPLAYQEQQNILLGFVSATRA